MNQLITCNNVNDGLPNRRYTGFPLNSTLVSSYTPDTIRSIINHAAGGKPYTTAVWIRISRVGVQISAQDPQIARTRIPVFIPIGLVHDIFMQPNINNVICIVYDEVKSTMKGVLLYVVHPADAHLLRDDFRLAKQTSLIKGSENAVLVETNSVENNRLFSPGSQQSNDNHRNGKSNRQHSPKRVLYIHDHDNNANREVPTSIGQHIVPQLGYTPLKGSYHSSRDNSAHRRNKSPRKGKTGHSSSKPGSDNGSKHRRKYRSRSPQKPIKAQIPVKDDSEELPQEQINPNPEQQQQQDQTLVEQQQQIAAWQAAQQMPLIPMGIYNRYVPKTIPLPSGDTIKTTVPSANSNGQAFAHIEPHNDLNDHHRSPSHSRSVSPRRHDQQARNRPLSAQNGEASSALIQSAHFHHHHRHHHHHRRHHPNGHHHTSSRPDPTIYNTISHSSRTHPKYLAAITNSNKNNNNNSNLDPDDETKQYLKQLLDDMQAMKLEMNKIRLASSSVGTTRVRSDSLQVNLKELRSDIDAIRARMVMTSKISK